MGTNNKCMELPKSSARGVRPYLWSCKDSHNDNQLFGFAVSGDGYSIVSKHSRLCLEYSGMWENSQEDCVAGRENQKFWSVPGEQCARPYAKAARVVCDAVSSCSWL